MCVHAKGLDGENGSGRRGQSSGIVCQVVFCEGASHVSASAEQNTNGDMKYLFMSQERQGLLVIVLSRTEPETTAGQPLMVDVRGRSGALWLV